MSFAPNEKIGPYRLLSPVYTGQSARLWKARDDGEQKFAALKILLPNMANDRVQVGLLRHEYEIALRLNGESFVKVYDFGKSKNIPYIVMEWFPSPSVKDLIQLGYERYAPTLPDLIPRLFTPLIVLHAAGLVHRDVKPDNYLYSPDAGVRLIDFALTRPTDHFVSRLFLRKGVTQGTATYMSPEQVRNQPLDGRADLYSLGCTLIELVTGRPAFSAGSMNDLLQKHLTGTVPSTSGKNKNVTPQFSAFLASLIERDRQKRPASVHEAFDTLQRLKMFHQPPAAGDKLV